MTDARAYVRVSTTKQEQGISLTTQRDAIADAARQRGLTLLHEYVDILSGTRDDRPAYQTMLAALTEGSTVIVWRLDRIGRRKSELFRFFEECKRRRIALVSVTQPELSNALVRDILSVLAAYETEQLAERIYPAMTARAIEGRWVSRAPRWYVHGANGHLVPAPDAAEAQRAFEMFVTTRNLSTTALAFGTRTKTMNRYLRNRVYLGEASWTGIVTAGAHPAIVTAAVWEAANAILDARLHGARRARPDTALLTGYLFVGGTHRRLYRQPDARRGNHRYATRGDGLPVARYSVRCDVADAWAVTQLASLTLTKADRAALLRDLREQARHDPHKATRTRLARQQASLERERDGTATMLARGQIDRARWERMDQRQTHDLAAIAAQIATLPAPIEPSAAAALATVRIDLAARVNAAWQAGNVAALRILLETFVSRIDLWTEPSEGLRGKGREYWKLHPPRFTICWTEAVVSVKE